ncbi:MAG: leucine-rich repeat protein, partial [Paludibacteraceae bacterium]|nr:leucine-rich repeat protein [Paludibacteraceae bacterium]
GKGIKTIGNQAFIFCSNLRKVRWSDCLESIGDMAFYNCTNIGDTVFFPKTLKTIGSEAFHSENYNSSSKVMVWEVIHMNDFIRYESDVPGECHFSYIIFGDSVEYIPAKLCKYMYNDSIHLPETLKEIGANAFLNCKMRKINIPESVTKIGAGAFENCTNLKQLILPAGLKEIPEQLCHNCTALDSVRLPEGLKVIPQKAFFVCSSLHSIHLPNSITNIGNHAFAHCMLDTLVLPTSLTVLGDLVFNKLDDHASPKHLVLNDKLIATGVSTFANWTELQTITIGRNVAILGGSCFWYDSLVTDITCYASHPPIIYDDTFEKVPDSARLHVPAASLNAYKSDQNWSRFRIMALGDEEIIVQKNVTVEPGETTANFTWPTDSAAHSYQIDIYKDGAVFCKLTLGANGQLLGIAFTGQRDKGKRIKESNPSTLSFMVTGLDEASRYNYVLSVLDEEGIPLHVYIGDFATLGYTGELKGGGDEVIPTPPVIPHNPEEPEGTENVNVKDEKTKVWMDGRLILFIDGKTFDFTGKRIE